MTNYSIKDLNKNEKPREKLISMGASYLTDEELIALIIGSGGKNKSSIELARDILRELNGVKGLFKAPINTLTNFKNINTAKACAIKAAVELSLRISSSSKIYDKEISTPKDVYNLLVKDFYLQDKEILYLLCLNSRKHVISKDLITIGTTNETIVHPKDVYKRALEQNAVYIILAHNHPSNDPKPSNEDIQVTDRLFNVGKEMGIPLLDHLIITDTGYYSLNSNSLINSRKGGEYNDQGQFSQK